MAFSTPPFCHEAEASQNQVVMSRIVSMDRILFAVFTHENKMQGIPTLLALTHNL